MSLNVFAQPQPCSQTPTCAVESKPGTAMWVWRKTDFAGNLTERTKLLNYAIANGIRTLYLDSASYLTGSQKPLIDLIEEAAKNCIRVEILVGSADWYKITNHSIPLNLLVKSLELREKLSAYAKPFLTSFQTDIEPHTLGTITQDVALQYYTLHKKLVEATAGTGFTISATMPFWLAQPKASDDIKLTVNGVTKSLAYHMIDLVDHTIYMTYRDTSSLIEAFGAEELNYGCSVNKKVYFAVETICLMPTSLSFCEEGKAAMDAAISKVNSDLSVKPYFGGVAKHHYHELLKWN